MSLSFEDVEKRIMELKRKKQDLQYQLRLNEARGIPSELTKDIPDSYTILTEIEKIDKELENLNLQLRNVPRIIKCVKVKGNIVGRYEYKFPEFNIKLYEGNKWGCPQDLETGFRSEVITDKDNIPIMVRRYLRNSDTKGYLLCYEYPIELDVKPNPEEIKPKREVKEERKAFSRADMIQQKSYVDKLMERVKCPQCGIVMERVYFMKSSNLLGESICPNCTYTTNWNKLPPIQDQNTKEEQEQNKKGILSKIKKK